MVDKNIKSNRNVRDKKIQIRLSNDEKEKINKNAGGLEVSTFLRELGLNKKAQAPAPPAKNIIHSVDPIFVREVARIGNNINQIAKHLNLTKELDREAFTHILKMKADLDAELERVKRNDT